MKNKAEGEMLAHEAKMMAKFKEEREANPNRGKSKQVIVMRTDLGMRKGKMIAQGAHASMKAVLEQMTTMMQDGIVVGTGFDYGDLDNTALGDWLIDKFTKICVKGESEEHIKDLYAKAKALRIPCSLILDAGLTEFKEPTYTCIAIGPAWSDEVDKITGGLSLL